MATKDISLDSKFAWSIFNVSLCYASAYNDGTDLVIPFSDEGYG